MAILLLPDCLKQLQYGTKRGVEALNHLMVVLQNLSLLPVLLQASVLALLSTSLPLRMTLTSTRIAIDLNGILLHNPTASQLRTSTSLHVIAFSSGGDLLVAESEGRFSMDTWEKVIGEAEHVCRSNISNYREDGDICMDIEGKVSMEGFLRSVVGRKISADQRWKEHDV